MLFQEAFRVGWYLVGSLTKNLKDEDKLEASFLIFLTLGLVKQSNTRPSKNLYKVFRGGSQIDWWLF